MVTAGKRGRKKGKQSMSNDEAWNLFCQYKGQIEKWRELANDEGTQILRLIYQKHKDDAFCLNVDCTTKLSTHLGMAYHLKFCGILLEDRPKICTECGEEILKRNFNDHMQAKHPSSTARENIADEILPEKLRRKSAAKSSAVLKSLLKSIESGEDDVVHTKRKIIKRDPDYGVDRALVQEAEESENASTSGSADDSSKIDQSEAGPSFVKLQATPKATPKTREVRNLPITNRRLWMKQVKMSQETMIRDEYSKSMNFLDSQKSSFTVLSKNDAETYLEFLEANSIRFCGANIFEPTSLALFESRAYESGKSAGFCGGPIVATAWCPYPSCGSNPLQFLAVSTHPDRSLHPHVGAFKGCLQIWSFDASNLENYATAENRLKMEFLVAHDFGLVFDLKWCPSGAFREPVDRASPGMEPKKGAPLNQGRLGILAMSSGTGDVILFEIPHPGTVANTKHQTHGFNHNQPAIVFKARPFCILRNDNVEGEENFLGYCIDWSHFDRNTRIAAGFVDGSVSVWNLHNAADGTQKIGSESAPTISPILTFKPTHWPIRHLKFICKSKIFISSVERHATIWDLDSYECLWTSQIQFLSHAISCAPTFPGYVACCACPRKIPPYPAYYDLSLSSAECYASQWNPTTVLAVDTSLWHGNFLLVDNLGNACVSSSHVISSMPKIKGKYSDQVLQRTKLGRCDVIEKKNKNLDFPITFEEAKENCCLRFDSTPEKFNRPTLEKEYKSEMLGYYPISALFTANWNPNEEQANLCCFGGDSGLLFVCKI